MRKPAANLSWLASRSGSVTDQQLKQIQEWIDADWESHDIDRDSVRLIRRLVATLDEERKARARTRRPSR